MMDDPRNPRHPTPWFTRKNLLETGLLMEEDLEVGRGDALELRYGLLVLDAVPDRKGIESLYEEFVASSGDD